MKGQLKLQKFVFLDTSSEFVASTSCPAKRRCKVGVEYHGAEGLPSEGLLQYNGANLINIQ
jgi:hypothetical protein